MRNRVWMLALLLMIGQGAGVLAAQTRASISVSEQYLFAAANAERTQRGLRPLHWDESLYRAADGHAREMAARRSISHQYPGEPELSTRGRQAGVRFSVIAENVAESPNAVRMHEAWMNSPGHRANLLDAQVDAVGIRVVSRGGELYAVEDFARVVADMSLEEQESAVETAVQEASSIAILPPSDDTRRTCSMETGFAGHWQPTFVMRYTGADLTKLPGTLKERLRSGQYRKAAVGACEVTGSQNFTAYSVAVMLFP